MSDVPDYVIDLAASDQELREELFEKLDAEAEFAEPERVIVLPEPAPRRYVDDVELQEELTRVADGARIQQRVMVAEGVTDVFVNGGNFAPGRARWVQMNGFDPVEKQAAELAASLQ